MAEVVIQFVVMGFASHSTWALGYQRNSCHQVHITTLSGEKWKWRFQIGVAEVQLVPGCQVLILDGGMLDVTPLVALLRAKPNCPRIFAYLHENQLTTPWSSKDRDVRNNTHWHYGVAHWRSLMTSDGFIFNSQTQYEQFATALPALIKEQCPKDSVCYHLEQASELLSSKCTVLTYGLDLDELLLNSSDQEYPLEHGASVLLWNARLEEDKNPGMFMDVLTILKQRQVSFRLIVLGTDPSKAKIWMKRIEDEFKDELLFMGWCEQRQEYARHLKKATVVLSTALHETFGISVVESVFAGALPLLPERLSYPELFPVEEFGDHFYNTVDNCVEKLIGLLKLDEGKRSALKSKCKAAIDKFRWPMMGSVYDIFLKKLSLGEDLLVARAAASRCPQHILGNVEAEQCTKTDDAKQGVSKFLPITEANDKRVALYRPKSLRDHTEYHKQLRAYKNQNLAPSLHGGRRAMTRMMEAYSKGARIQPLSFLTTPSLASSVLQNLSGSPASVFVAEKSLLDEIRGQKLNSGDAIMAMIHFPIQSDLSELISNPPILVLDDVRSSENVGSILRTAFCLGITSVVASKTAWAALEDSRAARCSMGTMYYHKFVRTSSIPAILREIKQAGIEVYGIEIGPEATPISAHGVAKQWAAVLGNEDTGLQQTVRDACGTIRFIPQAHGDSLNVGHAAAIALFELGRENSRVEHDGSALCK